MIYDYPDLTIDIGQWQFREPQIRTTDKKIQRNSCKIVLKHAEKRPATMSQLNKAISQRQFATYLQVTSIQMLRAIQWKPGDRNANIVA